MQGVTQFCMPWEGSGRQASCRKQKEYCAKLVPGACSIQNETCCTVLVPAVAGTLLRSSTTAASAAAPPTASATSTSTPASTSTSATMMRPTATAAA
jgi:hypothetical protein